MGYLVKDAEITAIADAIRAAAAGRRTLSPEALEALIHAKTSSHPHPDNQLTDREREVLNLMVRGMRNPEIAAELVVTLSTVKFHISMIFKKLEVTTRTEAVVKALENGLVDRTDT
jgi:DNA-binding NarL/FixJ family response regulator